ncbi:hypothetical protein Asppvi_001922 [Aspergillus pseudoviridinutans]|uniref:Uncharacterized protein n=1 Tax=Aspergillus pseudoviridinutans TaxID=1517512 RepID=A0A9P3BLE4_9EURO|nr:uncharacterized protein Asppvi_001922 [Aspergillus pseudoviridinutans]GIJ92644.1 hypothetical protein Asppvi_001922 [Aspergillus pseudoviridinutans]
MPDSPMEAKYLSDREKVIAVERLRQPDGDHFAGMAMGPRLGDVLRSQYVVLVLSIPGVTRANYCRIPSGGISTFGNLIIKSFEYNSFETILFNIPLEYIRY